VDYRGEFGRDRDRILFSSAFRRLAGKTQVVPAGELGDFHNRLTHSVKVAQLGRRLAQYLQTKVTEGGADEKVLHPGPDPELVEAACLAHDLGHPPFGHAGEIALNKAVDELKREQLEAEGMSADAVNHAVKSYGGFEGNAQTLRILVYLSVRQPRGSRGLNLTRATLDATIKYPWERSTPGATKKWNVYPQERELAEWVRSEHGLAFESPRCFEAEIMDWADDVTYACHDVEDFYRAGLIPLDRLFAFSPVTFKTVEEPAGAQAFFDDVRKRCESSGQPFDRAQLVEDWSDIAQIMRITEEKVDHRDAKADIHRATSGLMTYFVQALRWSDGDPYRYEGKVSIDPDARRKCDLLKDLIWFFVIDREALGSQQVGQQQIIRDLLRIYATGDERLLPRDRREESEQHHDKLRACVDHVASMTEPGAIAMHHRLTGIRTGLHSDQIWRT
jgi:dGTPase